MSILESQIERKLVEGIKILGGMCLKFVSPSSKGVPDRIVLLPNGKVIFVELKTETGRLSKIQEYIIDEMQKRKADVRVLYGLNDVKMFLTEVEGIVKRA